MNKRIKLPAQEWLGYDPEKGDIHGYTFEQMREFTELIVQECVSILLKPRAAMEGLVELSEYNRGWVNGRLIGIEQIKDHFGIE